MEHVKTGKADTRHDIPSHVDGIHQGNSTGNYEAADGHKADGRSTARRSTGISAEDQEAVDPRMPNLSPA